jgi:hypothetical protein
MSDAIVVRELGGTLPAWVDEQAGAESNVWIVAQRPGEIYAQFAARAARTLPGIGGAATTALLVHGPGEHGSARHALIAALCERMRPVAGRLVLVPAAELAATRAA